jgi:ABC-type molybdate transport system substrate-binding protein
MNPTEDRIRQYRPKARNPWLVLLLVTVLLAAAGIGILVSQQTRPPGTLTQAEDTDLVVYCAAGIRKPVEALCRRYEDRFKIPVSLNYGSSGELESKLVLDREQGLQRADLYIPADESFSRRARGKGLCAESIPLARFSLVLAGKPDIDLGLRSLSDVWEKNLRWTLCEAHAGAGQKTRDALADMGLYERFYQGAKAVFPRVPEAAAAIAAGELVDCGFIWDATAKQFGLRIYDSVALPGGTSGITVNVVESTPQPTRALHLARWLAAREHGSDFTQHGFTVSQQADRWAEQPELLLFSGGLNREAVAETLREFEQREGCRINVQYAGCGTLVAGIEAQDKSPDGFLTCDASYLEKVATRYGPDTRVSHTHIVMLVRAGNPKGLNSVADLARPGLRIGTNDPTKSTLGALSWELFRHYGVDDAIRANDTLAVFTPTAHELITQMEASSKLDVALVYRANVQHLSDNFELIDIDHPRAKAVQNAAVARDSDYPLMGQRLIQTLVSSRSRERYTSLGFGWEASP